MSVGTLFGIQILLSNKAGRILNVSASNRPFCGLNDVGNGAHLGALPKGSLLMRSWRGLTQHQGTEPCKSMAERALGLGSSQPNTVRMEQARAAVAASIGNRPIKTRASTRLATFDHDVFEHGHTVVAAKPSKSMQEIRYKLGEDELGGFDHQNSEPEAPRKDRDNANESDDSHLPHTDDDDYLPFGSDSFEDDAIPFAIPGGANPNGTPTENGSGCIDLSANFVSYCSEGLRPKLTEAQVTGVRLMDALRRNRAPLKAYKDLSEWHLKENGVIMEQQVANDAGYHYVSRETLIKMLMVRYEAHVPKGEESQAAQL